jgi:hypothetical protein
MEVSIAEVSSLKPHEETIPEVEANLMNQILHSGMFKHPILVDKDTNVILDGMHRHKVALRLGLKFIPVIYVKYQDPLIKILRWWRASNIEDEDTAFNLISSFGLKEVDMQEFEKIRHFASLIVLYNNRAFIDSEKRDSMESYKNVKILEDILMKNRKMVKYIREDTLQLVSISPSTFLFAGKIVSKEEVKSNAIIGKLFPHKSTCHIFPARVYSVNLNLELLRSNMNISIVDNIVTEKLLHKSVKYIPRPCIYDNEIKDEACYEYQ